MATDFGLTQVSVIFDDAYDKPISEEAYGLWQTLFQKVSDADLVKAAYQLVLKRQKTSKVSPGEIEGVLEELGIHLGHYEASSSFRDNPAVRALDSRYLASEAEEGISLHEWLKQEGFASFQEAMAKYGDHVTPLMPGEPVPLLKDIVPF